MTWETESKLITMVTNVGPAKIKLEEFQAKLESLQIELDRLRRRLQIRKINVDKQLGLMNDDLLQIEERINELHRSKQG
jgi:regulator of replication initiation timing